jgi:hypothetical protein
MSAGDEAAPPATVDFSEIITWYQSRCDDSWEHQYGVRLKTLDNPGRLLIIDLINTDSHGRTMAEVREGVASEDHPVSLRWIHCFVSDN